MTIICSAKAQDVFQIFIKEITCHHQFPYKSKILNLLKKSTLKSWLKDYNFYFLAPIQPIRRPATPPPSPAQPARSVPLPLPNQPRRPNTPTAALGPAFAPPNLYVAPVFDEFGNSLTPVEDYQDYIEYDDYEEYSDDYEDPEPVRPRLPRPPNSNLGPDLQPKLPNFNNVDILDATEDLRSRDKNQISFLNPGEVNAGILPLAFENPTALNLFPPLLNPNPW